MTEPPLNYLSLFEATRRTCDLLQSGALWLSLLTFTAPKPGPRHRAPLKVLSLTLPAEDVVQGAKDRLSPRRSPLVCSQDGWQHKWQSWTASLNNSTVPLGFAHITKWPSPKKACVICLLPPHTSIPATNEPPPMCGIRNTRKSFWVWLPLCSSHCTTQPVGR